MPKRAATLKAFRVRAVLVPLRAPVIAGIGRFDQWPLILVDLETNSGIIGRSYVAPYRAAAVPSIAAELRDLAAMFQGKAITPHDVFEASLKSLNVVGLAGVSTIATSALDMALWDALAKEAGLPLVQLLGGSIGPVRAYNSNGLWRHEVSTLSAEARSLQEEGGFSAMKLRLGNAIAAHVIVGDWLLEPVDAFLVQFVAPPDRIAKSKSLVEIDHQVYVGADAVADRIKRCEIILQMGPNWPSRCVRPCKWARTTTARATSSRSSPRGRSTTRWRTSCGSAGVTGWVRAAGLAGAAGVQFSNHLYPEISAHLMRVTPSAHWLEWVDWANPILADPLEPRNGEVVAPDRPGSGVDWNEDGVRRYAVEI
jgi:mandelate racemase